MKFRSRIARDGLTILLNITSTIHKLGDTVTVFLDESTMRLAVVPESMESPRVYVELNAATLFGEYRIESQQQNQVIFECTLSLLIKALTSGKYSSHCIIKLAKRQEKPCLSLEFKAAESMISVDICHDIPIKLMRIQDGVLQSISPPQISAPTAAFYLPKNKLLRTIIDRLTKFHKIVQLKAFPATGRLTMQVDNAFVKIETFYHGLQARDLGGGTQAAASDEVVVVANVSVNIKRLVMILDYQNMIVQDATLCITPKEALVLHISLSPQTLGTVTYYLPVLVTTDEDDFIQQAPQTTPGHDDFSLATTPSDAPPRHRQPQRHTGMSIIGTSSGGIGKGKRYVAEEEEEEEEEGSEEDLDRTRLEDEEEGEGEEQTPIYYSDSDAEGDSPLT